MKSFFLSAAMAAIGLFWAGCAGQPVHREKPPVVEQVSVREKLLLHLKGKWEATDTTGKKQYAVFDGSGNLSFEGGLQTYNPAHWDLDAERHELRITFPSLSNKQLQIFQLYVGQGIKAFDPHNKQIVYVFQLDTWTLNIAGWDYSKPDNSVVPAQETDPVFK